MPEQKEYRVGETKFNAPRRGPGHGPRMGGGEKAKDFGKAIQDLVQYSKRYLVFIAIALIMAAAGTILNLIGPSKLSDMTKIITDGLMTGIDLNAFIRIAVTLAVLYGLGALFTFVQGWIMTTITQRIEKGMREDISHKINRMPLKYFDSTTTGDVLSRVTNDVDTVGQAYRQSVSTLVTAVTMFFGCILMMFRTNWIMAVSGMLSSVLGFVLMTVIVSRSQKFFVRQQNQLGALNGHIEETYAGHTVVKAYNGEGAAQSTFLELNNGLYDSAWKSQFLSGMMGPLMGFIGNFGYVVVCVVGAVLTLSGVIGFEVIVAFMIYIRLFTNPLSQIAQAATNLQSAAAAGERVFAFLSEPEMSDESGKTAQLATAKGNVVFDHVRFGYDPEKVIIHDFSAEAKAGQKIAIVGPTGAGKTTMVNLLMRFYETNSGTIRIDGVPVDELTRTNVHALFCMVLQDTWLFEGTVRENIVYAKQGVSDADVVRACKAVGLHSFIKTLPHGYDTVLDDNTNLSAGQRQLVTIARAMIENAPMLILDEATSSVDTRTEMVIQKAMDTLMQGRTSFVIAHRLSTIRNADLILVMKDGDVIESGTHETLMAENGFYAELYNSQFETAA
ncbi:MAG: ABC transporter ATP-binding protein [Clostridia bacterium]|nr:ABC transporter ATP-binding protein [Clostridia bacterium]